jgi:hypothetical protein
MNLLLTLLRNESIAKEHAPTHNKTMSIHTTNLVGIIKALLTVKNSLKGRTSCNKMSL